MAFVERLAEAGFTCSVHHGAKPDLASWLATLPRPCCLFAANDERARHVLDTCLSVGLAVPQDISVLSCDNDEIICETTTPPLSSIQFDTMQTGFRIAAELDRLMHGCPSSAPAFTYTIANIVTRYSSEVVHVADPLVERALSYIRFNAAAPLPVDLLVAELHVSRRHLEQRFRLVTGRSIHAEIVRTRLARAQTLLRTSQMGVDEIAAHCAFPSASHLCAVFRRHFGVTPSAFRRGDAPCEIAWPHSSGRR